MSYKSHSDAMGAVMQHFGWDTASIITSPTQYGIQISNQLQKTVNVPAKVYAASERYTNIRN